MCQKLSLCYSCFLGLWTPTCGAAQWVPFITLYLFVCESRQKTTLDSRNWGTFTSTMKTHWEILDFSELTKSEKATDALGTNAVALFSLHTKNRDVWSLTVPNTSRKAYGFNKIAIVRQNSFSACASLFANIRCGIFVTFCCILCQDFCKTKTQKPPAFTCPTFCHRNRAMQTNRNCNARWLWLCFRTFAVRLHTMEWGQCVFAETKHEVNWVQRWNTKLGTFLTSTRPRIPFFVHIYIYPLLVTPKTPLYTDLLHINTVRTEKK